jgi:ABC-type transporter Mla subunit MlaD
MKQLIPTVAAATIVVGMLGVSLSAQPAFTKAQVNERIKRVEDGVDEFRKYLEHRGDDARDRKDNAEKNGEKTAEKSGKSRRGGDSASTEARTDRAKDTKDDLDEALGDLNRSTNRLRRDFDPKPDYMQTRVQVDRVMDDARKVNQIMTRGSYGSQPQRLWAALRTSINELARCYGLAPMGR